MEVLFLFETLIIELFRVSNTSPDNSNDMIFMLIVVALFVLVFRIIRDRNNRI